MVQTNMGMTPVIYGDNVVEVGPNDFVKTKKKIWQDNEWVDKTFIRLLPKDYNAYGGSEMEKWCRNRYGEPKMNGPWNKVSGYILMDDKTYMFWKLCE